ncbi:MAG TPA: amidohydrolase family protein [Pyrinomonadaceae bacterium]|nr:amidohydrolase family protein [Pyrinomonadaceae bacterium]
MIKILAAEHVLPISSEPITDGAVAIETGEILDVGQAAEILAKYPSAETENFGKAAILPGFVNCHSHLELTAMRGALDHVEHDFRAWLLKINELRAGMTDADIARAAIAGALEGAAAGVTCVGDIGRMGHAGVTAVKQVGLRGIVFQETEFSPDNRTAGDDFLALAAKYEKLRESETDLVKIGISPHSTYTVSSRLFELIAQYSIINRVPLSIHASEAADEVSLLTSGEGFFTEVYEKFGVEWHSPHCSPIEYLERLGVLSARPLLAHCVRVSDSDITRIASNQATIAHCPKSNAKFGHGFAPFESFLDAGIAVGLGSDSVASNNVCDLLEESRFAALFARNRSDRGRFISAREVLEAATFGGARALGLDHLVGTLESGKQADIVVISLNHVSQQPMNDVEAALVFSSNGHNVILTLTAGSAIYSNSNDHVSGNGLRSVRFPDLWRNRSLSS